MTPLFANITTTLINEYLAGLQLTMIAYCLLPNHYHWLVRQDGQQAARKLPQYVFNRYTKAFNNTYGRSGTLFESRYKAIPVNTDEYLRYLCAYIHANPVRHAIATEITLWPYSNYLDCIGKRSGQLVDRAFIAAHFGTAEAYELFVKSHLTGQVHLPKGLSAYLAEL